jgi:Sulfotransferase family
MSITTIEDVKLSAEATQELWGCSIDSPKPGNAYDTYCFDLMGWALGRSSTVKRIEVLSQGTVLQTALTGQARPDIARAFPANLAAGKSGFRTQVNLVGVPPEFEISLVTVNEAGRRGPFGTIVGKRSRLGLHDAAIIQPLLVTTLGRTGSTWFMRILGQHQSIIAYRPFEFDTRAGIYWVHVFRALSDAKSYLQPLVATEPVGQWWLGPETMGPPRSFPDPALVNCVGGAGVSSLAAFCQRQLDQFYRAVADAVGCPGVKYVAEKYLPDPFVRRLLREWYPGAKEVLLVRDPRDIFCSIESYNAKRGYLAFGRNRLTDEGEYIRMLIGHTHRLVQTWKTGASTTHLLRYEDLVRDAARTLTTLLKYLEIDCEAEVVDGVLQRATVEIPAMGQHRTSRSSADSIGRWRRELPTNLRDLFVSECGQTLAELGYE